jgi:amiloride-sensitive sodium channel
VIVSFVLCGVFIAPGYQQWIDTPTITSLFSTSYPVWNIYFPAVTICSNNRIVQNQLTIELKQTP